MRFFCFNDIKMRHHEQIVEKCLVLYQFINLKLFHPEWRNSDRTDLIFLDTGISKMIFDTEISRFEITYFFNLAHACSKPIFYYTCLYFMENLAKDFTMLKKSSKLILLKQLTLFEHAKLSAIN